MVVRMVDHAVWIFLFFLSLFEVMPHTKISVHGNSHAFIQANSDVRYLVDGIPVPVHKELVSASGVRVPVLDENPIYNSKHHLKFDPPLLDFKERHLGMPHHEKVTLFNVNNNKTIHMSSISGNTVHFHSSFFEDKIIPPLGNTTFNVVFLGREEGEIESNLFIHTSEGSFKYRVKGASVSSPYRLRPLVGVRVPLNATYAPLISIHNPHTTPMQIVEVYSSGGEFHLELPSGELEGPKHLWEIPPFHTKPVIRIRFVARAEKNHTAYVRIKVNKSEEVLVVPLEVEVSSQPGLYSHEDIIDFGIGGSHDRPRKVKLALYNSLKKVIRIQNVVTSPFSKALRVDFQPLKVPPDSNTAIQIATLTFDWNEAFESKQFSGKIIVKSKQNQHKLVIPYIAQVLEGGLEYNASVTQYCSELDHLGARNFTVRNSFKVPLALTNVSLQKEAEEYFNIEKFNPVTLNPGDSVDLFQLSVRKGNFPSDFKLISNLLIYSNVSTVWVPLLCYNGRLSKVIVSEFNETDLNFGTVGSASQREAHFALFNYNPVPINIEEWGTNFTGAVVELLGVAEGNQSSVEGRQNFNNMNMSTVLEPNWYAVLKVMVTAPDTEEELSGDVYVKTQYEIIRIPVRMRVAHGRLEVLPDPLILDNCFPGKLCKQTIQVRSLFSRAMTVTSITSVPYDPRVSYWLANTSSEIIPLATSTIGEVMFDPASSCGNHCYLGVNTNSTAGSQWLQLLELPSHVHDLDLSLLSARYTSYVRLAGDKGFPVWQNISLQLHTTEVRRHMFWAKVMMTWPLLTLNVALSPGNTSVLTFPLTQIGNTTYKDLVIHNPSSKPLTLQLVMDWAYPVAERLLHDLPDGLTRCHECHNSPSREFTLEEGSLVGSYIQKLLGVLPHTNSLALVLQPGELATTRLGFSPHKTGLSSAVLLIRNNLTILEIVRLSGRAAHAQFKFGNRKPGSDAPLMFELAEKHLKDCEREKNRKFPVPNLTVKRSFTARNTGDLNIYVSGFNINGLPCEGYGFRVLNCVPFQLPPNGTRKIDIAFTPDFTLARIQRSLSIETSLGINVNYSLITTLPPYFLASCSSVLGRPSWEPLLYYSAISFMTFILFCVLAAAFLESDRILKCAFVAVAKDKALRAASEIKTPPNFQKNCDIKSSCAKPEVLSDSAVNNLVSHNEKRHRDSSNIRNVQNNICPKNCWSNFEERNVVEAENKEKPVVTKFDETEACYSSNSTPLMSVKNKKKLSKKNSGGSDQAAPTDLIQENQTKKGWSCFLSRTTTSQQNKPKGVIDNKTTNKNTQEIEISNKKILENPKESKRANQNHKKCVRTVSEPAVCSEEETSSTTTESSNNDEIEKERENLNCNRENKAPLKKDKGKEMDYKDNYEGDCDDDEYEQEGQKKKDYGSHWKPNTKSTCNKTMSETPVKVTSTEVSKSASLELPYKLKTSKPVSRERKEKNVLKKRTSEKNGTVKTSGPVSGSGNSSSSSSSASSTVRVSPPLRTSGSCWGEHRASFSDVVARSDSTLYSSIVAPRKRQQPSSPTSLPTVFSENNTRIKSSEVIPTPVSSSSGLGPIGSKKPSSSTWDLSESQQSLPPFLQQPQEQSSLFVDALTEPTPVDTEEEKTSALPYGGDAMWEQSNSIVPLLEEDNRKSSGEFRRQDLFRENWPGVDSLWEPLYTPAVDNSQLFTPSLRNEDIRGTGSVWGSLIGSVWSSSTWSNGPGPVAPPLSSGQTPILSSSGSASASTTTSAPTSTREDSNAPEENTSEMDQGLGFDPFRSLNTIWFPSSPDSWNPAGSK